MAHRVVHFEIGCTDVPRSREFFRDLFAWEIDSGPSPMIRAGDGIGGHLTSLGHEPRHYVNFYIEVEDVAAHLERVKALGGRVVVPPVTIPNGTFAWFADPDGNVLGLWKPSGAA